MSLNVELKADATEALTDASQNISKGSGRVWNLFFGKKEADIRRTQMLVDAQAQKDCQLILSGKMEHVDGKLVARTDGKSLAANILAVEQGQELENLAANTAVALEVLQQTPDEEISDKEVDPDFFARWRREAKVIGTKELQFIWGKILSEEVKKPESISFRTLDVVKNLTCVEAELFQEVAKYTLYDTGVTVDYLVGFSCDREEAKKNILRLESCGLISRSEERLSIRHSAEMLDHKYVLQFNDYDLVVRGGLIESVKVFPFTSEGVSCIALLISLKCLMMRQKLY